MAEWVIVGTCAAALALLEYMRRAKSEPVDFVLILARNVSEAERFANDRRLNSWAYAETPQTFRGMYGVKYACTKGWQLNPGAREIKRALQGVEARRVTL